MKIMTEEAMQQIQELQERQPTHNPLEKNT